MLSVEWRRRRAHDRDPSLTLTDDDQH